MTNNKKIFSVIIIIFTLLVGITGGIVYFAFNITKFTTYDKNTTIANLYIGGLFGNEAKEQLTRECLEWRSGASIDLVYQDYNIKLDNNVFKFDINESVKNIKNAHDNQLYLSMRDNYIEEKILANFSIIKYSNFNFEQIQRDLTNQVALLKYDITIDLGNYLLDYNSDSIVVNEFTINLNNVFIDGELLNFKFKNFFKEITIKPNKQFSFINYFNDNVDKNSQAIFSNEELSLLATGFYQVILPSNFNNISKNTSMFAPNYSPNIIEAKIDVAKKLDLSFYNPNSYEYYIKLSYAKENNDLIFTLVGLQFVNNINYQIVYDLMQPKKPIYWYYNEWNGVALTDKDEIIYQNPRVGYRIYVIRNIVDINKKTYSEIISEDIYMPIETIIIKKPK